MAGEQSAEMISNAVNTLLDDISHDRTHQIRQAFDRATLKLIDNLKNDPEMAARAGNIKHYLKNDEAFNRYLGEMWADLRQWLKTDMQSEDSRVKQRIANAGLWFGETLMADASLQASLNEHLEQAAHRVAPDFAAFHPPHQRHGKKLGRRRYVTPDRAEYRQRFAVHPRQRHAGGRDHWFDSVFALANPDGTASVKAGHYAPVFSSSQPPCSISSNSSIVSACA
jgi:hypothetical protein